ncbi:uncharacterized protein [Leptinotarsa decemlineata]|uniref:uncharacterized protein n=1 Tax=Leptinotarsa decemlineata TaxID=7539 RepID=UPI003D3085CD
MGPFIIYNYFNLLKEHVQNIPPSQIYNLDETSFCLDPSRIKVVGEKGKAAHRTTSGPGRENITVLLGGNAAGEKRPPLIVFKGKNIWDSWITNKTEYPKMTYSATKNGWMETEMFTKYFENNFLQNIGKERPVILIYDAHTSHISIFLIEKAIANNIIIIKLPPYFSHLLQPMDLCVFKSLKVAWDVELTKWQRQNYGTKLPKAVFSTIISKIWSEAGPALLIKGYEKGGIYPFNNQVIAAEKFDPEAYRRWNLENSSNNSPVAVPDPSVADQIKENQINLPSSSQKSLIDTSLSFEPKSLTPSLTSITFESIILEQLKQVPKTEKTTRKKICKGAEVITTLEAIAVLKEQANKVESKPKKLGRKKKKNSCTKKRQMKIVWKKKKKMIQMMT